MSKMETEIEVFGNKIHNDTCHSRKWNSELCVPFYQQILKLKYEYLKEN